jgi:hypothetical protein
MAIRPARPQKPGPKTSLSEQIPSILGARGLNFGNGLHWRAPRCRGRGCSRLWGEGGDATSLELDHLRPPLGSDCRLEVRGGKEADDGQPAVQIFLSDPGISLTRLIQKQG